MKQSTHKEKLYIKDITSLNEISEGNNDVMVTYALTDDMKIVKIITLYNESDIQMDEIGAGHGEMIKYARNISLFRRFLYKRERGDILRRCGVRFYSVLLKTIKGFFPDEFTHDLRTNKH